MITYLIIVHTIWLSVIKHKSTVGDSVCYTSNSPTCMEHTLRVFHYRILSNASIKTTLLPRTICNKKMQIHDKISCYSEYPPNKMLQ